MEFAKKGDAVAIRLDEGEEIASSLLSLCKNERILSATFCGIGACRKAEISHYDTASKKYHNKRLEGKLEIVSLCGNIAMSEGEPAVHAHIALGLDDFSLQGGHLVSAEVNPTCEISLIVRSIRIERKPDAKSGLRLQSFQK
jgi:predicted DNA-binding protein with PD1-like motif